MPSSTSNFERTVPGGSWVRTWLLAVLLAGMVLTSLEVTFRSFGHQPCVIDDMALWSLWRHQVYPRDGKTPVVLLGESRMQLDFVPREMERLYPQYRVIQLALDARGPVAALRDLALDKNFRGLVLCDINAWSLLKSRWDAQAPYVAFYHHEFGLNTALNTWIKCGLQSRFVVLYPALRPDVVLLDLVKYHALPTLGYQRMFLDRSRSADYSLVNIAQHQKMRVDLAREQCAAEPYVSPEQWLREAAAVEPYVQEIQGRGGQVVFIRFPITEELWRIEQEIHPRAQYWDTFARQTAATTIHFQDYPTLACLPCPDLSHLDARDAVVFTRALLALLEDKHVLARGERR